MINSIVRPAVSASASPASLRHSDEKEKLDPGFRAIPGPSSVDYYNREFNSLIQYNPEWSRNRLRDIRYKRAHSPIHLTN